MLIWCSECNANGYNANEYDAVNIMLMDVMLINNANMM